MFRSKVTPARFSNRRQAGRELAQRLQHYRGREDVVVLALPRGGVPVAHVVAGELEARLDIFVVRKIGMPGQREYAIGAIASGDVLVLDRSIARSYGVSDADVDAVVREEQLELARREHAYRRGQALPPLNERVVILVDDGLATGATMKAAVQALRKLGPARLVVAAPVGAPSTCAALSALADEVVCVRTPEPFSAVGQWYDDFSETTDEEVTALMDARSDVSADRGRRTPGWEP